MKKFSAILLALVLMLSMTAMAASITINTPNVNGGNEAGITYKAYKIFDATIAGTNKVAYTIDSDANAYWSTIEAYSNLNKTEGKTQPEYFTLTPTAGDATVYTVAITSAYTDDAADTFADVLKTVAATAVGTQSANKITGLTDGYYLVTSSVGSDLILKTIGDITVDTKNAYPSIDKWVEWNVETKTGVKETTADHDEILTYAIQVTIPEDAIGEIVVHDDMTNLEYQSMTAITGITDTKNPTKVVDDETVAEGCEVHFTLSGDYVAANKGTTITIVYTAKFTGEDDAENDAWLTDDTYTSKTVHTDVHTTDIIVDKYVKDDAETKLAGATFVLKNEAGNFYKVENGSVTWVAGQANGTPVTTDANGYAEFANMADGTYYLVETAAPTGYNLLTTPVTVTVAHGSAVVTENEDGTTDANITTGVANSTGSEMPSTGGMGTTIFYVVGGLMMAAALVLLVSKRKVAASK